MELKRHLDPKIVFIGAYLVLFVAYIIVGLQPVGAVNYLVSAQLSIPEVGIHSDVTELDLVNGKLDTPETIVGSYSQAPHKTLLIGHSTDVFRGLDKLKLDDIVQYDDKTYRVVLIDMMLKNTIDMKELLRGADKDTIVIMTCAGTLLDGGDATHRLMVTAVAE